MTNDKDSEDALTIAYLLGVEHGRAEQNTQTDALKIAREALDAWRIYFEARAVLADCERNRDTTKRFDNALYKIEDAENMAKAALAALKESK